MQQRRGCNVINEKLGMLPTCDVAHSKRFELELRQEKSFFCCLVVRLLGLLDLGASEDSDDCHFESLKWFTVPIDKAEGLIAGLGSFSWQRLLPDRCGSSGGGTAFVLGLKEVGAGDMVTALSP